MERSVRDGTAPTGWQGSYNRRILVIDDDESVRDNFAVVLQPRRSEPARELRTALGELLGETLPDRGPDSRPPLSFEVDFAANGREGLEHVRRSADLGQPYAVIFCDLRMPGWSGLETIERIRQIDRRAEIIFITAYSDHDIDTIVRETGSNVSYFVKPFAGDEVKQMATKGVFEWNKARELESLIQILATLRGETVDMERLLTYLLRQICLWLSTDSGALFQITPEDTLVFKVGVGQFEEARPSPPADVLRQSSDFFTDSQNGLTYLPIREFGLAIALTGQTRITPDRLYILRIFLEHASVAIQNSVMHSRLIEAEQLGAVGLVTSYLLHDLRGPVGSARTLLKMLRQEHTVIADDPTVGMIDGAMGHALELLDETLEYARGEIRVEAHETDLVEVLRDDLAYWQREMARLGIRFRDEVARPCPCRLDPARFRRVVKNLVTNASEALAGRENAELTLRAWRTPSGLRLEVEDNGPGVPTEVRATLFKPFVTQGKRKGSGLGLAISERIVAAHGGFISLIDPNSNRSGSVFRVELPPDTSPT